MSQEISLFRLYLMRLLYLLNFVMLGSQVWPSILGHTGPWDPIRGVALSFWAALSLLSGLGLRYPAKMLPLFLMQFFYKSIWLLAIALPRWPAFRSMEITRTMLIGVVVDVIVIPWPYVFANYVTAPADRWRRAAPQSF